jgi:hypothetical protein
VFVGGVAEQNPMELL